MDQLRALKIIGDRPNARTGCPVLPKSMEQIPKEAMDILTRNRTDIAALTKHFGGIKTSAPTSPKYHGDPDVFRRDIMTSGKPKREFQRKQFAPEAPPPIDTTPGDPYEGMKRGEQKELCAIIIFALSNIRLSRNKLNNEFHLGDRINSIIEILIRTGIISREESYGEYAVLPKKITDISPEVQRFLVLNGKTQSEIKSCFPVGYAAEKKQTETHTEDTSTPAIKDNNIEGASVDTEDDAVEDEVEFERLLAATLRWALKISNISAKHIKDKFKTSKSKTKRLIQQLDEWNMLGSKGPAHGGSQNVLIHHEYKLPQEAKDLLSKYTA
jgi:hypothetical protein